MSIETQSFGSLVPKRLKQIDWLKLLINKVILNFFKYNFGETKKKLWTCPFFTKLIDFTRVVKIKLTNKYKILEFIKVHN